MKRKEAKSRVFRIGSFIVLAEATRFDLAIFSILSSSTALPHVFERKRLIVTNLAHLDPTCVYLCIYMVYRIYSYYFDIVESVQYI